MSKQVKTVEVTICDICHQEITNYLDGSESDGQFEYRNIEMNKGEPLVISDVHLDFCGRCAQVVTGTLSKLIISPCTQTKDCPKIHHTKQCPRYRKERCHCGKLYDDCLVVG